MRELGLGIETVEWQQKGVMPKGLEEKKGLIKLKP